MNIRKHYEKARFSRFSLLQLITGFLSLCANKLFHVVNESSMKKYKVKKNRTEYYDIKGVKLIGIPYVNFNSIFLLHAFHNDSYDKALVDKMEYHGMEAPYCYKDGDFDVTIKENDIVIDAGASIGEFSAYVAYKKAKCYAFEPVEKRYKELCKTAELNQGYITPVKSGLNDSCGSIEITTDIVSPSFVLTSDGEQTETIDVTTLDMYCEKMMIDRVDFIKSDIEGAERFLLLGAKRVLKEFAPKLSICTYHLHDDPTVLASIILEANPKYKIVQLKTKLVAMVI